MAELLSTLLPVYLIVPLITSLSVTAPTNHNFEANPDPNPNTKRCYTEGTVKRTFTQISLVCGNSYLKFHEIGIT